MFFILHLAVSRFYLVQFQRNFSQYIEAKLNIGESDLCFVGLCFRVFVFFFRQM